jgi:hypothetical protein
LGQAHYYLCYAICRNGRTFYHFLTLIIQMGHDQRDITGIDPGMNNRPLSFFSPQAMVHDCFLHILKYLYFADNETPPNKNSPKL